MLRYGSIPPFNVICGIALKQRMNKLLSVWVLGVVKNLVGETSLDYPAVKHYDRSVGKHPYYRQIVGDKQNGYAEF